MSLLMDALRKAEESKRQAAQKQQEGEQQETQIVASESSAADDLQTLEESLEFDREHTPSAGGLTDVDVPFDFEIDENFRLDETGVVSDAVETPPDAKAAAFEAKPRDSEKDTAPPADILGVTQDESSEEAIDYLKPDDLSRFSASSKSPSDALEEGKTLASETAEIDVDTALDSTADSQASSLGLTLEERAPDIERASIINDELITPTEAAVAQAPMAPAIEGQTLAADAIRASRNDDAVTDAAATNSAGATARLARTGTPKFAEESRKRESARAVFNAKHKGKGAGSRRKLFAAAAIIALFPLAGGGYLLLQAMGIIPAGNQYNIPPGYNANVETYVVPVEAEMLVESELPDISPEPLPASAAEQEALVAEVVLTVEEIELAAAPEAAITANSDSVPLEQAPSVAELAVEIAEPTPSPVEFAVVPETSSEVVAQEAAAPSAINITRTDYAERVDPQLTQAYASYRGNDFIGARARYQQVLRDKPNNRDAMLGLAAVAMQLGDAPSARETYVKLLELDPRDVHARVGLLETMPASDPVMLESELRALFAAHPEVAQLAFALGNLFASQRRWSDAQQSYYDALLAAKAGGSGPVSPDYAFNLAVSLERLNQLRPAYSFYRQALEQSELVSPGFDIRVLRERLDALERVLP